MGFRNGSVVSVRSKTPTKAEYRRMGIVKENGCVIHMDGAPCQAHHLLSGGVRCGHNYVVGLCPECHFRIHNEKRAFFEEHDTSDRDLLKRTNKLVAEYESRTIGGAV